MTVRRPLRFQDATEKDVALILQFIRELAEYEESADRVSATEDVLRKTLFGEKCCAEAVIAYSGQEAAAFAIYFFSYSSFSGLPNLYLEDLFVRPAYRGLGAGKELFAFLAHRANERGCGRMEWSVLNRNEPAIGFYRKLGAEPVTDWTVFHLVKDRLEELAPPGLEPTS